MYTHINDIINLQYKIKYVVYYEHLTADKFKNTGASNEDYKIFVDVVEFVETALKNDHRWEVKTADLDGEYFGLLAKIGFMIK